MSHRPTRTAIKVLEYFSRQQTREECPPWQGHVNKREVQAHLEEEMDSPPSGSTLTRIFTELEDLGYLDRNTQFGLKHGRWYPTQKAQSLNQENRSGDSSSKINLAEDLEELKDSAEKTIEGVNLVGLGRTAWIKGLIDGITGLALLHPDMISTDGLDDLEEELKAEPDQDIEEEDIRNSPALPTYLAENPTGWECHFCSGYPTYHSLKKYLEHLEEAHDYIIDDIDILRTFEL